MATQTIEYIDGSGHTLKELNEIIINATSPKVLTNMITDWPAAKWSMEEFINIFGAVLTKFKLYPKLPISSMNKIEKSPKYRKMSPSTVAEISTDSVMETECFYVDGTFQEFKEWLDGSITKMDGENIHKYPRELFWCYADYNYMPELFLKHPSALDAVDWSPFGFPDRNGFQSTIWVGSEGAYTPCHQDTYGLNLVAQICGMKRWLLISPEESKRLQAVRIPYEESSVFTSFGKDMLKSNTNFIQVDLRCNEVLIVPKHWWHFVESLEPSISINTWIEMESDKEDRVRESLVQTLVYAIKTTDESPEHKWLNPKQRRALDMRQVTVYASDMKPSINSKEDAVMANDSLPASMKMCLQQIQMAMDEKVDVDNSKRPVTSDFLANCLCEKEVLDKLIKVMEERRDS